MKSTIGSAGIRPDAEFQTRRCYMIDEPESAADAFSHLEWEDGWLVAVPNGPMPTLTVEMVEETLDQLRSERGLVCECAD